MGSGIRARLRVRTRARELQQRGLDTWVASRYAHWRTLPIAEDTVLYESFFGIGMLDHPEAIFRHLIASDDLAHLRHVWVLDSL
jgi:hypothetical protein